MARLADDLGLGAVGRVAEAELAVGARDRAGAERP